MVLAATIINDPAVVNVDSIDILVIVDQVMAEEVDQLYLILYYPLILGEINDNFIQFFEHNGN